MIEGRLQELLPLAFGYGEINRMDDYCTMGYLRLSAEC
jgi:hypothetical protein